MRHEDTAAEAMSHYVRSYASLSGPERVERAMEMAEQAKQVTIQGIRDRNPHFNDADVHREWMRLLHGDEVVEAIQARAT